MNLQANPAATIEVGRRKLAVTARTAEPEERARLWPLAVEMYPGYDDYRAKTSREIPVVILTPAVRDDVRLLTADDGDVEEMRFIRGQLAELAPPPAG